MKKMSGKSWVYLLLLLPLIAYLWVLFYAKRDPSWMGIPFFYWYQTVWIALTTGTMGISYALLHRKGQ